MTNEPIELKPCPFCGGKAQAAVGFVTCSNKACEIAMAATVEEWNRRTPHESDKALPADVSPYRDYTWEDIAMLVQENKALKSALPKSEAKPELDVHKELKRALADKDELARRNALLRQRNDLPVDRLPAHRELVRLQKFERDVLAAGYLAKKEEVGEDELFEVIMQANGPHAGGLVLPHNAKLIMTALKAAGFKIVRDV